MERCPVPLVKLFVIRHTVTKCAKMTVANTCRFHRGINSKQRTIMNHCNTRSELSSSYLQNPATICNIKLCKLERKNIHIIANNNCNIKSNCDSFQRVCDIHNIIKAKIHSGIQLNSDTTKPTSDKGKTNSADSAGSDSDSDHSGIQLNSDTTKPTSDKGKTNSADSAGSDSDSDDPSIKPVLDAVTPNSEPPHYVNIVPGKGPPPEPPVDCCMSGCANCVWIQYCEELKRYFSGGVGQEIAKQAIENIDNPGLKMFLKLELGFLD